MLGLEWDCSLAASFKVSPPKRVFLLSTPKHQKLLVVEWIGGIIILFVAISVAVETSKMGVR